MREQKEPLPRRASIVQTLFSSKHYIESTTQVLRLKSHNLKQETYHEGTAWHSRGVAHLGKWIFKNCISCNNNFNVLWQWIWLHWKTADSKDCTECTYWSGSSTIYTTTCMSTTQLTAQRFLKCPTFHLKLLSYAAGTPYWPMGPAAAELPPSTGLRGSVHAVIIHMYSLYAC